jgi:hypothetical protein
VSLVINISYLECKLGLERKVKKNLIVHSFDCCCFLGEI